VNAKLSQWVFVLRGLGLRGVCGSRQTTVNGAAAAAVTGPFLFVHVVGPASAGARLLVLDPVDPGQECS
jgi:hypothetical protein